MAGNTTTACTQRWSDEGWRWSCLSTRRQNRFSHTALSRFLVTLAKTNRQTVVSNWILTSSQPHRVASGRSNSVISKRMLQKLFSIYKPCLKSIHKTNPYTDTKRRSPEDDQTLLEAKAHFKTLYVNPVPSQSTKPTAAQTQNKRKNACIHKHQPQIFKSSSLQRYPC